MELGQEVLKRAICRIVLLRCPETCLFQTVLPWCGNTLPLAMQQVSSRTSFKKLYLELLITKSQSSNTLDLAIKARGWWPGTWSSSKIFFWQFCISLSGLGPSETHEKLSMRKMCDSSNEKQGGKLFLLWRHSALLVRPFSWLAKNRRQGNPCQYALEWSDTLRCALPLQAPLTCTSRLSCLSSDRRESHWKRNLRQR